MSILPQNDIPIGTSISVFFQFFGGAIFLAIGENIFVSRLASALHTYAPTLDATTVVAVGAEGLRKVIAMEDPAALANALHAYDIAIMSTFYLCIAGSTAAFLLAFGVECKEHRLSCFAPPPLNLRLPVFLLIYSDISPHSTIYSFVLKTTSSMKLLTPRCSREEC
jgi:hypothetical protein